MFLLQFPGGDRVQKIRNAAQFFQTIQQKGPLLILCKLPFCGSCQIAESFLQRNLAVLPSLKLFSADLSQMTEIMEKYSLQGAPSYLFFIDRVLIFKEGSRTSLPQLSARVKKICAYYDHQDNTKKDPTGI